MSDPVWRPISDVPKEWRSHFITFARLRMIRMRARKFHTFQISQDDQSRLRDRYILFANAQHEMGRSAKKFDEWSTAERRILPIITTTVSDYELVESIESDGFLESWNWQSCSHQKLYEPANLDRQKPGYAMSGIEFDAAAASDLGCAIRCQVTPRSIPNATDIGGRPDGAKQVKRRGRTIGSGFQSADQPLVDEMLQLHSSGVYPSLTKAAESMVHRASGASQEAIVKRLVKRARAKER